VAPSAAAPTRAATRCRGYRRPGRGERVGASAARVAKPRPRASRQGRWSPPDAAAAQIRGPPSAWRRWHGWGPARQPLPPFLSRGRAATPVAATAGRRGRPPNQVRVPSLPCSSPSLAGAVHDRRCALAPSLFCVRRGGGVGVNSQRPTPVPLLFRTAICARYAGLATG
jgi:hypothetical protein